MPKNIFQRLFKQIFIQALVICTLLVSLFSFWKISSQINHLYHFWHNNIGIEKTISIYAPKNRYGKKDFELTTIQERSFVFNKIVKAINSGGKNLDEINYLDKNNNKIKFLTEEEIIHLKDVAEIIATINYCFSIIIPAWVVLLVITLISSKFKNKIQPRNNILFLIPDISLKLSIIHIVFFCAVTFLAIAIIGHVDFFYWLHKELFPDNHKWFFYYQESLMSTFMQAPDLFGYIALQISIPAVLSSIFLLHLLAKFFSTPSKHTPLQ